MHRPRQLAVVITLYPCGYVCRRRQLDSMKRLKAVSDDYNIRTWYASEMNMVNVWKGQRAWSSISADDIQFLNTNWMHQHCTP